jgi:ribosomal-protein-alanine N-acetyltransferase
MDHVFKTIETERLILRNYSLEDSKALYDFHSNKENFLAADLPIYSCIEEVESYILKMNQGLDNKKWYIWAMTLKATSELIGSISMWNLNEEEKKAEFGYALFPAYRKHGFMKEATEATLAYAFQTLSFVTLEAYTKDSNKPSIKLLESLNFNYIETIEDDYSNGALMAIYRISTYRK